MLVYNGLGVPVIFYWHPACFLYIYSCGGALTYDFVDCRMMIIISMCTIYIKIEYLGKKV